MARKLLVIITLLALVTGWNATAAQHGNMAGSNAAFFMKITNKGTESDRLVSGNTQVASAVQIHETKMQGNQMKMAELADGLEIPAGETVVLEPQALHVMLIGITDSLVAGTEYPVHLMFEKAGDIVVTVPVLAQRPAGAEGTTGPFTGGDIEITEVWGREAPKVDEGTAPAMNCMNATPNAGSMNMSCPAGSPAATPGMAMQNVSNGAFYFTVVNNGDTADRLVSATSDVSPVVEVHNVRMNGNQMEMYQVPEGVEIPAGESVVFKPKSLHVMLIGIDRSLIAGDSFSVTLVFENAGEVTLQVPVLAGPPSSPDQAGATVTVGDLSVEGIWAREAPLVDGSAPIATPESTPAN